MLGTPALGEEARRALALHLGQPRYEIFPADGIEDDVAAHVPRELKITVTVSPRRGLEATLSLAEELAARGCKVAPHLAARLVRDESHLRELLSRIAEAGLRDAFVVAGDLEQPAGAYAGAADLLAAMTRLGHGLDHVGITGYPESHPLISDETTIQAMFDKVPFATYIVSQVCFEPQTIVWWIGAVRERGVELPIDVGIPGVASRAKLLRVASRIGVGESIRFLSKRRGWISQLFRPAGYSPEHIIEGLVPTLVEPDTGVAGFHVYTFNELAATERWRRAALARLAP
ncbi:MAG TPA: methylenetetrahydrofolate reductase [Gaiellaceae bacterium]|jgi:methylenetetrahydrofolate reductase (NADPH)|nr:methylenetetrahydrofolate reductase [Gaiellaceae bacterium]